MSFVKKSREKLSLILSVALFGMSIFGVEKYLAYKNGNMNRPTPKLRYILLREQPPFTDEKWVPDDDYMRDADSLIKKEYRLGVDEGGFIKPSKVHEKPDINIVFLGGSTTQCSYVDEKLRFPCLAGRIIEKGSNKKVNSYNSGVNGNNSLHSIDILLNKVIPMNPDIVVMGHNVNDLLISLRGGHWISDPIRGVIVDIDANLPRLVFRKIKDSLFPNIYASLAHNKGVGRLGSFLLKDGRRSSARTGRIKIDKEDLARNFASSLQTFISICKAWSIKPVLITQAGRLKDSPDPIILKGIEKLERSTHVGYPEFKELFDLFNETIRKAAKENDVLLIDLASEIPQEKEYMYDMVHFNDNGSALAATIIGRELIKLLDKR